ncbi:hypothetical protein Q5762_30620 [Streptomyces sp. P9(2023)]|uniref:hypothetical protein n=1 Tax=Streptomyces sp. P9(2023) TaxID=3064394 RepID=UPI0028F429BC|nr:hypothetical protein [Streptomyces sp. P9(2023)]MDT9692608.1 hypothetical protein [Streptomyces sp. P9(2023)]
MLKTSLRAAAVLALVAAVASPVAIAAPAPALAEESATVLRSSLRGAARMDYPVADEDVRFSVDAHSTYGPVSLPTRSWGTFRLSHSYRS